jgi:signal transduction histidine kinase
VAFPEFVDQYKPMKQVIGDMCGLAVANARKFKIIRENEKQLEANAIELKALSDSKDRFFSIIAHDLRSPLGSFLSATRLMAENPHTMSPESIQVMAVAMMKAAVNLYSLLENLLQWSQMKQGALPFNPENIRLVPFAKESVASAIDAAQSKQIEIAYDIPFGAEAFADKRMLETVIRNLVSNAIKFTEKGGRVTVSASNAKDDDIEVKVSDTGIGMSADLVSKLFLINERTGRKGTEGELSTGLGLLICKEFVEKHGGRIWFQSAEKKGSTFHFTIPAKRKEA